MAEFQIKESMGLVLELARLEEGSNEVVKQAQLNFGPNGSKLNRLNPPLSYSLQFSYSHLLLKVNSKSIASTVLHPATMAREIETKSQATTESVYIAALALGIASQWMNILSDVGEEARRGGTDLPHDEIEVYDYNNFTRGACVNKLKKMLAPLIAYASTLFQKLDISWVGATGYGIALNTILVIVSQLSRSVHFERVKHPFSVVTMTGVLARKMGWLHDELTKTATTSTLRTRWISRRRVMIEPNKDRF
ncbi:uncharacterized protein LOC111412146 [Olea europaea var. sylvestris]|uniref:uncharacterized protein LOC111412146 n=1 Tax=Olea europaea var. sylvestris TaxID=158386 RepID=UPI000C1D4691|nr:uncharacterized protein LOC111412146 [Olea europaea var. sylvestris]